MLRIAALSLLTIALLSTSVPADPGAVLESPLDGYLAAKERLAPLEAQSRATLQKIISSNSAGTIEIIGDISGRASSAGTLPGGHSRMLMMTLDDGSHVALHGGDEIDRLRVGERVAVIASIGPAATPGDLILKAWVHEWALPPAQAPEQLMEPQQEDEILAQPKEPVHEEPSPLVRPRDLPDSAATLAFRADAVQAWKAWVLDHNSRLTDEQAEDIVTWVLYYSQQHNVNHKLIFALIKWESWFKPENISHAGAIGLMQVMPGTARGLGIDPYNVQQNIEGGIRYLARQLETYRDRPNHECVILALACYNAGPNAVKRAGHRVPNIRETRNYVRKVTETFHELHDSGMP